MCAAHPAPPVDVSSADDARATLLTWGRSVAQTIEEHWTAAVDLHACIERIYASTRVGLANLQLHTGAISQARVTLEEIASKEFAAMEEAVQRCDVDVYFVNHLPIHPALANDPTKTLLGAYIAPEKMHAAAKACRDDYTQLQQQYATALQAELPLSVDLADLVTEVEQTEIAPSAESLGQVRAARERGQEALRTLEEPDMALAAMEHAAETLHQCDAQVVQNLLCLVADRNELMYRHLNLVQDISSLQSEYAELGTSFAEMDAALASPTSAAYRDLQQLAKLPWAYAHGLVEAVRRTEFSQLFMDKAQSLAELMARFSDEETKKRKEHAANIATQLPWELGLESHPPTLEITTKRRNPLSVALVREDLTAFLHTLERLAHKISAIYPQAAGNPAQELHTELQPLVARLDGAEAAFTVLARAQLHIHDDDASEDGSEDGAHPSTLSQSVREDPALRRQLAMAHERSQRLEEELARRTAEWNAERHAWERTAPPPPPDASTSRARNGAPWQPRANTPECFITVNGQQRKLPRERDPPLAWTPVCDRPLERASARPPK